MTVTTGWGLRSCSLHWVLRGKWMSRRRSVGGLAKFVFGTQPKLVMTSHNGSIALHLTLSHSTKLMGFPLCSVVRPPGNACQENACRRQQRSSCGNWFAVRCMLYDLWCVSPNLERGKGGNSHLAAAGQTRRGHPDVVCVTYWLLIFYSCR